MIWLTLLWAAIFAVVITVTLVWIDSGNNWTRDGQIGMSFLTPVLGGLVMLIATGVLYGAGYASSQFTKADETVYTVQEGADIDATNGYVKAIVNVNGKPESIRIDANRIMFVQGDTREIKVERYERINRVTLPWNMNDENMVTVTLGK